MWKSIRDIIKVFLKQAGEIAGHQDTSLFAPFTIQNKGTVLDEAKGVRTWSESLS